MNIVEGNFPKAVVLFRSQAVRQKLVRINEFYAHIIGNVCICDVTVDTVIIDASQIEL